MKSPKRDEVTAGDKTELLELEPVTGAELQKRIKRNEERVAHMINLSSLLPFLQEKRVVSKEEKKTLEGVDPERRNSLFLQLLEAKGAQSVEKFVECVKENEEHRKLYDLLGK